MISANAETISNKTFLFFHCLLDRGHFIVPPGFSLLFFQQIPNLRQQEFLLGGLRFLLFLGLCFLFLLLAQLCELVEALHQEEDHQGQDQEVDDGGDKVAVIQGILDDIARLIVLFRKQAGEDQLHFGEVHAADEDGDNGHDDVIRQAFRNGGEGGADNGANRQRHGVALDGKGSKFIPPLGFFHFVYYRRFLSYGAVAK